MSETGRQGVGTKFVPPPCPPGPPSPPEGPVAPAAVSQSPPPRVRPWFLLTLGGLCLLVTGGLLIQAHQMSLLRRELASRAEVTPSPPLLSTLPTPPPVRNEAASATPVVSDELLRLRNEVGRLHLENEEMKRRLAQQDAQLSFITGGVTEPAKETAPLMVRTFNLNASAVLALADPQAADRVASADTALRAAFQRAGADLTEPASVNLSPALDRLALRANAADLQIVEQTLTALGLIAAPR